MRNEIMNLETEVVGSDDGKLTYEIRRKWSDEGAKAVVIELYPSIKIENMERIDLSYMHLQNHLAELGIGEVRIVNLFCTVFDHKPLAKYLIENEENIQHIKEVCQSKDIDMIIIAYGSTLGNHQIANSIKSDLLKFLIDKKLDKKVKHLVVDYLDTNEQIGTHPLYLGLRFSKEEWMIADFPLKYSYEELKKHSFIAQAVDEAQKKTKEKKKSDSKDGE